MTQSIIKDRGMWHGRLWLAGRLRFEIWSAGSKRTVEVILRQEAARLVTP